MEPTHSNLNLWLKTGCLHFQHIITLFRIPTSQGEFFRIWCDVHVCSHELCVCQVVTRLHYVLKKKE